MPNIKKKTEGGVNLLLSSSPLPRLTNCIPEGTWSPGRGCR